jgi:ubiquinone biosynthesis protein
MKLLASAARVLHLISVATRHSIQQCTHRYLQRWPRAAAHLAGPCLAGPMRLRLAIEEMGGTFIKFGQMLALQSDLLPLEYCKALYDLLDQVPAFGPEHVERIFREELGHSPNDIFDEFDPQPIATGSIGQVHVAVLTGRKLAVKVRRPTVLTDFGVDMALMTGVLSMIRMCRLKCLYWVIEPTNEFIAWTLEELDYRHEARYMDELGRHSSKSPRELVPTVFWEYTTRCILTVDYLDASTVLEYLRMRESGNEEELSQLRGAGFDPNLFARNIIDNFLSDAFQHGMFHADLHPANLMILPSSQVGYIDFGIAGVLSSYSRQHLLRMTLAYSRGDLPAMCEAFFLVSTIGCESDVDAFREGLKQLAHDWYGESGDEVRFRKSITVIMLELLTLSRKCAIWPQRDVIKYIRSAIAIDGLIKQFAPGFDVGRHLESVCDRQLHWRVLRELVSAEAMVGWLGANTNLIQDGAARTLEVMRRLACGDLKVRATIAGAPHHDRSAVPRTLSAGGVALLACLGLSIRSQAHGHGISFTMIAMALAAVLVLRLWPVRIQVRE